MSSVTMDYKRYKEFERAEKDLAAAREALGIAERERDDARKERDDLEDINSCHCVNVEALTKERDGAEANLAAARERIADLLAERNAAREAMEKAREGTALLDRMQTVRMILIGDDHAVCVGGRWDGWKMWRHPDGQWVSLKKLTQEDGLPK